MPFLPPLSARLRHQGVALVIVLAFVVLVTGVIVAFFSRAISERQISGSSANSVRTDIFAQDAIATVVGDLRQEIAAGSTISQPVAGVSIYTPSAPAAAAPCLVGATGTGAPNLVKRSGYNLAFYVNPAGQTAYDTSNYPASNRAANSPSTSISQNGRTVSLARWNRALLLPKKTPGGEDYTPDNSVFTAPDWVLVARDGTNPKTFSATLTASGTNPVVGRYAYAVYDEGGLLDMNAAGYPDTSGIPAPLGKLPAYKISPVFADLKQLPGINSLPAARQEQIVRTLVGWRNYASTAIDPTQGNATAGSPVTGSVNILPGYAWTGGGTSGNVFNYLNFARLNGTGFLRPANPLLVNGQSDRSFASRQHLMDLLLNSVADQTTGGSAERAALQNALQYLGTFSRDLNQPSYIPAVQANAAAPAVLDPSKGGNNAFKGDKYINPSFLNVRVTKTFARNDPILTGSAAPQAVVGEPLVNKRFALNRLAWVTYQGPSASRNQNDADIQALISNGIPWSYLQEGTPENILKYFGLTWDAGNSRWVYDSQRGTSSGYRIIMLVGRHAGVSTPDAGEYVQDAGREPNFFELLKAGITVGSLGKAAVPSNATVATTQAPGGYAGSEVPANFRYGFDNSVDYHVVQIGANILSEVNPTSYPIRVAFNDGTSRGLWEFQGVTDLPYLSYVFNGVLRSQLPTVTAANGSSTSGVPTYYVDTNPFQYPGATAGAVSNPGKAYAIQVPAVWNPYDPNGTAPVARPTRFKVLIDSNDPINLANNGGSKKVWCAAVASTNATRPTSNGYNQGIEALWKPGSVFSYDPPVSAGSTTSTGVPISDAVTFEDGSNNGALYREPTLIFRTTVGNATRLAGNLTSIDPNPLPGTTDAVGTKFAPLVLGSFPLAFQYTSTAVNGQAGYNTTATPVMYTGTAAIGTGGQTLDNRVYFTYRLQYQDPSGNWITYDTKYGRTTHGRFCFQDFHVANPWSPSVIKAADGFSPYSWASAIDPRTARFGMVMQVINDQRSYAGLSDPPPLSGWAYDPTGAAATTQGITYPIRPDFEAGFHFADYDARDSANVWPLNGNAQTADMNAVLLTDVASMQDVPFPAFAAGWSRPIMQYNVGSRKYVSPIFDPGMYAQNNPGAPLYPGRSIALDANPSAATVQPAYYADADGVVRRAAGAYVPAGSTTSASTPVGLPTGGIQGYASAPASLIYPSGKASPTNTASSYAQSQSRPLLLHRPFRTVAELGYVFRDLPWKNLDFFTPESADAALLDLFCINEISDQNGMIAGKVDLNTRQTAVLSAILSGAYVDDPLVSNTTVGSLSPVLAGTIAAALTARNADVANYGPMQNVAELVGRWKAATAAAGVTYSPQVVGANSGVDLPPGSGYQDGRLSYTGFSGAATASASTAVNLTDAYATIPDASLRTSLSQIQRFHEAPIRALANVGQTRVWNLMIDVVTQTGRYPQAATALNNFVVEGEQRYWVHLAIDRLTGNVIDKQVEIVKE